MQGPGKFICQGLCIFLSVEDAKHLYRWSEAAKPRHTPKADRPASTIAQWDKMCNPVTLAISREATTYADGGRFSFGKNQREPPLFLLHYI
jgi:hypothetical protein